MISYLLFHIELTSNTKYCGTFWLEDKTSNKINEGKKSFFFKPTGTIDAEMQRLVVRCSNSVLRMKMSKETKVGYEEVNIGIKR